MIVIFHTKPNKRCLAETLKLQLPAKCVDIYYRAYWLSYQWKHKETVGHIKSSFILSKAYGVFLI